MEIKNKHLAALVVAKKELKASRGLYSPGDPRRVEIDRQLRNLEELQSGLKEMRREQLGYSCKSEVEIPQIPETQKIEDPEIFKELLQSATCVAEHFVEMRKGVAQTFYVVKIEEANEYYDWREECVRPIPRWAVGYWRQHFADDHRHKDIVPHCLDDDWIPTIQTTERGWQ